MVAESPQIFRFREFHLDVAGYQLRRNGRQVRLERQPMELLILLVARRGQLVTRSEIVDWLWGKDVFVDVETGVNTAVRKIRQALHDSSDAPMFVETVPAMGYRFIAPVEGIPPSSDPPVATRLEPTAAVFRASRRGWLTAAVLVVAALAGGLGWARTLRASRVTLAVLPFDNLSGDADRDYLAAGLTEETTVLLAQIDPDHISVVGRTSMMRYKHTTKSVSEIGSEMGADYLIEGSLRSESGRLRVTAKLVRVRDQVQVWSEPYEREPTSLLGLQQELASAIARQVRSRLSPDRLEALARRQTRRTDAYDLYLRGQGLFNLRTPPTTLRAIDYFERATALDPGYALAWSGLALAYSASPVTGDSDPREIWARVDEATSRAVGANPNLAEAQQARGHFQWHFEWDWPAAEASLRRATVLDPSFPLAHVILGHLLSQMGRHAEAEPEMRSGRDLDPFFAIGHALSSQVAFQRRDYVKAVERARTAIAVEPDLWIGHMMLGQAYVGLDRQDGALEALATAARLSRHNSKPVSLRGYLLAKMGRAGEARGVLATLETATSQGRYVPPYALALVHAGLGERAAVFEWLEKAHAAHDVHLMYLAVDAKWDPYRSDSRFTALLDRCDFMRTATPGSATR